ncbi:S-layer homology domain-containing protein [Paenibacillus silvae]|uniref:S-layer homology domain-containing protein n=1 Tax=Paenibacillus silvae TaxID=1325358 RepID=UPI002006053E|nr:S-layer homology domain-containing protein [Paenibacillus silvae]MCK6075086.1 S-layer homology domain-containing protein [Paenibacillus silvae]MCK6149473.1 S-layer homology domain-containing protein [Paenibacillus silvae]MCK6267772.1 S-layer homology domain-containing protein [Paenibacillus silvae]
MQNIKGYLFLAKYKRSVKSLLAMLLMVSMIFSWLPQAQASVAPVIHIGDVSGKPGDIIEVPVSYDSKGLNYSFYHSELSFAYDPAVLELVDGDEVVNTQAYAIYQGISLTKDKSTADIIKIMMTTQQFIDESTTLYSLHFKIKESAAVGPSSVTMHTGALVEEVDPLQATGENGQVTVLVGEKPIGNAVVYVGSRQGKPGDKITLPVDTVSLDQPIGSYGVRLKFNPAVLKVMNVTGIRSGVQHNVNNETGSLIVGWSDENGGRSPVPASEEPQTLFKIEFTIASGAAAGEYPIQIVDETVPEHFTVTDVDAIEMNKQFVPGSITVVAAPVTPTTPTTPTNPGSSSSGTSSSGSATTSPSASTPEKITLNVTNERNVGAIVSATTIERTTGADGRKKDEVNLTAEQISRAIQSLKQASSNIARILIPDAKDEVSELNVKLPAKSTSLMADEKMNLYIETDNASLQLPASSLQGLGSDVFFHLVPIKDTAGREVVKQRIQNDPLLVQQLTNTADFHLLGRPMMIETNMSSRPVTVVLPITEPNLTPKELDKLQVFIEHSDGTKELVKGKIVKFNGTDQPGIEFEVTKFSTFSIVHINNSRSTSYIQGYTDGTFRPNQTVQRAEMAALLSRVLLPGSSGQIPVASYKDMPSANWASDAITKVSQAGLMNGNTNGFFSPGRSITRAEMAVIIDRVLKKETTGITETFGAIDASDITQHWAKEAVQHVLASGIMSVSEQGKFRPDDAVTRAEAVTMLNRLLNIEAAAESSPMWKDVPASHWAYGAIQAASQN